MPDVASQRLFHIHRQPSGDAITTRASMASMRRWMPAGSADDGEMTPGACSIDAGLDRRPKAEIGTSGSVQNMAATHVVRMRGFGRLSRRRSADGPPGSL